MARRTKHAVRKWYGEIFRIPPREGGALAHCAFCSKSVWVPDRARKSWNAVDRAAAAIRAHVHQAHRDQVLPVWDPRIDAGRLLVAEKAEIGYHRTKGEKPCE